MTDTTRVRDVMTKDPVTIEPDAPLGTAMAVMRERGVRHLPVVNDAGRLTGIITDRDLRGALFAPAIAEHLSVSIQRRLRALGETIERLRVRDLMTWGPVTVEPDAPLARAAAIMFEGRFSSLPVVEAGRLVGIVTERDVLKALAATLPPERGVEVEAFLW